MPSVRRYIWSIGGCNLGNVTEVDLLTYSVRKLQYSCCHPSNGGRDPVVCLVSNESQMAVAPTAHFVRAVSQSTQVLTRRSHPNGSLIQSREECKRMFQTTDTRHSRHVLGDGF